MNGEPHFLEIVTPDPASVCALYTHALGLAFSDEQMALGGARIAVLEGGARLAVRGPLRPDEGPLWRIYLRVDDLDAAVAGARAAGAEVAIDRMPLGPDHGDIAIVLLGGVEHGYWQLPD